MKSNEIIADLKAGKLHPDVQRILGRHLEDLLVSSDSVKRWEAEGNAVMANNDARNLASGLASTFSSLASWKKDIEDGAF